MTRISSIRLNENHCIISFDHIIEICIGDILVVKPLNKKYDLRFFKVIEINHDIDKAVEIGFIPNLLIGNSLEFANNLIMDKEIDIASKKELELYTQTFPLSLRDFPL